MKRLWNSLFVKLGAATSGHGLHKLRELTIKGGTHGCQFWFDCCVRQRCTDRSSKPNGPNRPDTAQVDSAQLNIIIGPLNHNDTAGRFF